MVMDLMGPNLQELNKVCGFTFSLKTTLMLANQMLQRLDWLHQMCVIHKDIKPQNFVMGLGAKSKTLHAIDFGLG